jgi:hypothetical protein
MIRRFFKKIEALLCNTSFQRRQSTMYGAANRVDQKTLSLLYKQYYFSKYPPLGFREVGFRIHSQHEEDGILLFIFALIGTSNRKCIELCAGDGIECNTANLIVNHRWLGLLCDGNHVNVKRARTFYAQNGDTKYWPPAIVREWLTVENVNRVISEQGFTGEIDLLSLDIDGVDYWIWREISVVSPRVVVLEFNHLWGPTASVTVPYRDDFVAEWSEFGSDYAGASLNAFVKLGEEKGYRLVGTNAIATNAFFVRNDISCDWLPMVDPSACFEHPRAQFGMKKRLLGVKRKRWVEV